MLKCLYGDDVIPKYEKWGENFFLYFYYNGFTIIFFHMKKNKKNIFRQTNEKIDQKIKLIF